MILSGKEIKNRMAKGDIIIRPFDEKQLNPNSYNLKLHNELIVYDEPVLDMAKDNAYHKIKIPKEGLVLEPGKLYLGRTVEFTETQNLVPMLEGRSSIGRLGIYIHVTAGFGDVGFAGCWTLEIQCVQPVRIYPFVDICQIYYHTIEGEYEGYSSKGKYQGATGIQTSQIWKEFGAKPNPLNNKHIVFKNYDPSPVYDIKAMLEEALGRKVISKDELFNGPYLLSKEEIDDMLQYKSWDDAMTAAGFNAMMTNKFIKELGQQIQKGFEDGVEDALVSGSANTVRKALGLEPVTKPEVLYLCDRRACSCCNSECTHTSDITHAADFYNENGDFWQKTRLI